MGMLRVRTYTYIVLFMLRTFYQKAAAVDYVRTSTWLRTVLGSVASVDLQRYVSSRSTCCGRLFYHHAPPRRCTVLCTPSIQAQTTPHPSLHLD